MRDAEPIVFLSEDGGDYIGIVPLFLQVRPRSSRLAVVDGSMLFLSCLAEVRRSCSIAVR